MNKPLVSGRALPLCRPANMLLVTRRRLVTALLFIAAIWLVIFNSVQAQTITFTGVPGTEAYESAPYTGSVQATISNNNKLTFSAPVLPNWLTLNSSGASNSRTVNNVSIPVASGVGMDAAGNYYVVQHNAPTVYKVDPEGNVTSFAQRTSGNNYGAIVSGNYLYISYNTGTRGIERFDLRKTNPIPELVYSGAGVLSMTSRDGYLYAAGYGTSKIIRISESDLTATDFLKEVAGPFGLGFDPAGNLLIALYGAKSVIRYNVQTKVQSTVISGLPFFPTDVKIDAQGYLYLSPWIGKIRKYSPDYTVFTEIGEKDIQCLSMALTSDGVLVFADATTGNVQALQTGVSLTGTPALSDVGKHPVTISVTDGSLVKTHSFEITVSDPNPPLAKVFSPASGAVDVKNNTTLTVTFSEKIKKGSGNIILKNQAGDATIESIAISSSNVQIDDKKLSITPTQALPSMEKIYVLIDEGAVQDMNTNSFAGIHSNTGWTFRVEEQKLLPQTIQFAATRSVTYGDEAFKPGASINSGLPISYETSDKSIAEIKDGKILVKKAGTVTITATQEDNEIYQAAQPQAQLLTVKKAKITLKPQGANREYGDSDPEFTFTVQGLVNNDELTGKLGRKSGENVGKYEITTGNVSAGENYTIEMQAAFLTITQAPLTVVVDPQTKVYQSADPALSYQASGLKNNDKISGELSRLPGEDVGSYEIKQNNLTAGTNYTIEFTGSQLEIKQATLAIDAVKKTKIYGEQDPKLSFDVKGLVGNDKIAGALVREAGNDVGEYAIGQGTIDAGPNYSISFTGASFTIKPAILTVKAKNHTKIYGEDDPELTFSAEGLVNADKIEGEPAREAGRDVGSYSIGKGSLDAGANYTMEFTAAEFSIKPAALKVSANNLSKVYGAEDPELSYTVEGLVSGDQLSGKLSRETGKNVGKYEIGAGNLSAGSNYTMEFVAAELEIKPANLVITADNKSRDEWKENPEFTFTYNGLAENDRPEDLSSKAVATTTANVNSPAGRYDINVSGANSPNYLISYNKGSLTINAIDKKFVKAWRNGASLQIRIFTEVPQNASLMFTTNTGQVIRIQKESLRPGVNTIMMPIGNLSPNIYILQVGADKFKEAIRVKF